MTKGALQLYCKPLSSHQNQKEKNEHNNSNAHLEEKLHHQLSHA
jgi:hypothetical protein